VFSFAGEAEEAGGEIKIKMFFHEHLHNNSERPRRLDNYCGNDTLKKLNNCGKTGN